MNDSQTNTFLELIENISLTLEKISEDLENKPVKNEKTFNRLMKFKEVVTSDKFFRTLSAEQKQILLNYERE